MAKKALKDNSLKVLNYLKSIGDENVTAADIGAALGFTTKSTDAIVTMGLGKKGLAKRVSAEIQLEDGTHKPVNFIKLTPEGKDYDHEAAIKADIAEAYAGIGV